MGNEGEWARMHTVAVMVRGRLLECLSFRRREEAERFKRMVRAWALANRVQLQLWSQESCLLSSRADGTRRAGLATVA